MALDAITQRLSRFGKLLLDTGLARPDRVRGCTPDEIRQVQEAAGRPLPAAYVGFLERFGRGTGEFWRGSVAFFPHVMDLFGQEGLAQLAEQMEVALPPQERLVFFTHQGYDYLWLDVSADAPDPPVWELLEQEPFERPMQVSNTFTQLLLDHSAQLARDVRFLRERSLRMRQAGF